MSGPASYRAKGDSCPWCGRTPSARFSKTQVERCKRDRAAGHHTQIHCQRCSRKYWIRNGQIADGKAEPSNGNGRPRRNGNGRRPRPRYRRGATKLPDSFPIVAALREFGVRTVAELEAVDDLREIPGVGPKREDEIRKALDALQESP